MHHFSEVMGIWRCRICRRIMTATILAIIAIEILVFSLSLTNLRQEELGKTRQDISTALAIAVGGSTGAVEQLQDALSAVISHFPDLMGASIYDQSGRVIVQLGEPPEYTPAQFQLLKKVERETKSGSRYEILMPLKMQGVAYAVVAHVAGDRIAGKTRAFAWRVTGLVALIAGFVGIVSFGFTWHWIVRPAIILKETLLEARLNPLAGHHAFIRVERDDEIGELQREGFGLVMSVAGAYQDDIAAVTMIANQNPDGIVLINRKNRVEFVNGAFVKMWGAIDDSAAVTGLHLEFEVPEIGQRIDIAGLCGGASVDRSLFLITSTLERRLSRVLVVRIRFGLVAMIRPLS